MLPVSASGEFQADSNAGPPPLPSKSTNGEEVAPVLPARRKQSVDKVSGVTLRPDWLSQHIYLVVPACTYVKNWLSGGKK